MIKTRSQRHQRYKR